MPATRGQIDKGLVWYYKHQRPVFLERNLRQVRDHERRASSLAGCILERQARRSGQKTKRLHSVVEAADPGFEEIVELVPHKSRTLAPPLAEETGWAKSAKEAIQNYKKPSPARVIGPGVCEFQELVLEAPYNAPRTVVDAEALLVLKAETDRQIVELNISTGVLDAFAGVLENKTYVDTLRVASASKVTIEKTCSPKFAAISSLKDCVISATLSIKRHGRVPMYTGTLRRGFSTHRLQPVERVDSPISLSMLATLHPAPEDARVFYRSSLGVFGPMAGNVCMFSGRKFDTLDELLSFHAMYHPSMIFRKEVGPNGEVYLGITMHPDRKRQQERISYTEDEAMVGMDNFYYISPFYGTGRSAWNAVATDEAIFSGDMVRGDDDEMEVDAV